MTREARSIFELYVDDDRYEVPTLHFSAASDEASVRELAMQLLNDSPHHRGVEVRLNDRRILSVSAATTRAPTRAWPQLLGTPLAGGRPA